MLTIMRVGRPARDAEKGRVRAPVLPRSAGSLCREAREGDQAGPEGPGLPNHVGSEAVPSNPAPLLKCEATVKLLNLSEPHFPHL